MKHSNRHTFSSVILILLSSVTAYAQAHIQETVTSDYHRNSISFITVLHGDSNDGSVYTAVEQFFQNSGDKFDKNLLETKTVDPEVPRGKTPLTDQIGEELSSNGVGKQILSYIFNRTPDGYMNDSIIRFRGNYDATDQDVINARATVVGVEALGSRGESLINSSWVIAVDVTSIKRTSSSRHGIQWDVTLVGYAYKLEMSKDQLSDFFEKCWIYEEDSDEIKKEKKDAFNSYAATLVPVTFAIGSAESGDVATSTVIACSNLITNLEDQIPSWNVATTIYSVRPPKAKIGTKEGLKKGDRYRAYSYREDGQGNIITVKRGYLRATDVANNNYIASGKTDLSRFYQISGAANVQEGWTIKQKNDIRLGLILGAKYGGVVSNGGFSFCLGLDYLAYVTKRGNSLYAMYDFATDLTNAPKAGSMNIYSAVGVGFGLHATRFVEFIPYLMFGSDFLSNVSNSGYSGSTTVGARSAIIIEPGVKIAVNIFYPLQLILSGCYDAVTLPGSYYKYYNDKYPEYSHGSGWGLAAGFKWTF